MKLQDLKIRTKAKLDHYLGKKDVLVTPTMTFLVKNEADIIEQNILFHQQMGIKYFIAIDHQSTDGTLDILKSLQRSVDLIIIEKSDNQFQQSKWTTEMAHLAAKEFNANWIFPNDADEFWVPHNDRSLLSTLKKEVDDTQHTSIYTYRYNFLPESNHKSDSNPLHFTCKVLRHVDYDRLNSPYALTLGKTPGKSIFKAKGLVQVRQGGHSIKHAMRSRKDTNSLSIFHYPVRSFQQFKNKVEGMVKATQNQAILGPHTLPWIEAYRKNRLEEAYLKLTITPEQFHCLEEFGIVCRDQTLSNLIS